MSNKTECSIQEVSEQELQAYKYTSILSHAQEYRGCLYVISISVGYYSPIQIYVILCILLTLLSFRSLFVGNAALVMCSFPLHLRNTVVIFLHPPLY